MFIPQPFEPIRWEVSIKSPSAPSDCDPFTYSPMTWAHINLLGEYNFSKEELRDSVGIRGLKSNATKTYAKDSL
jgi:hypothetical protein